MAWRTRKRNVLPKDAKILRDALYTNVWRLPYHPEKVSVHQAIIDRFPAASWYSIKKHLTWCSGKAHAWRAKSRRRFQSLSTNPSAASATIQADLLRAMEYAWLRLEHEYYNPSIATVSEWAAEAAVSVATMAEAVVRLRFLHASLQQ